MLKRRPAHGVKLTPLVINPVFQCLGAQNKKTKKKEEKRKREKKKEKKNEKKKT